MAGQAKKALCTHGISFKAVELDTISACEQGLFTELKNYSGLSCVP